MNRTRRRCSHHCAVATATLAVTLGIFAATGAQGQATGGPAAPGTGGPGRTAPGTGGTARPTPGPGTPTGGAAAPKPGTGTPTGAAAPKPPAGSTGATGSTGSLGNRPSMAGSNSGAATTPVVTPAVPAPATPSQGAYADADKNKADIDNFVKLNLQNLFNDSNVDAEAKARENLVQATQPAGVLASPNFLFQYGQSLNTAFTAKLATKPNLRQRLNIAIVTARFAYQAGPISTSVEPTTLALLKDPAEPVVLWALRAAQPQVPQVLKQGAAMGNRVPPLVAAVAPAVFANPSGPIFSEAYQALTGNDKIIFDELTKLWQNRLVQYQTKVPQDPSADGKPAFKLTAAPMWSAVVAKNPALKTQVVQMVTDQLSAAAQWADQGGQEDTHAQLVALAQLCVQGLSVVATAEKVPTLATETNTALTTLNPKSFPTGGKVMPVVDPVIQQVLANFKNVKPAPQVGPGAPGNPGAANGGVAGQP